MSKTIVIKDIKNYSQKIVDGSLILTPKMTVVSEKKMKELCFTNSNVMSSKITDGESLITNKKKFRGILVDIWKSMPSQKIVQATTFNVKLGNQKGDKGYNWCSDVNMSFQSKDANGTMREIIHMVKKNKYNMELDIKLETNEIIRFSI